MPLEIVEAPYRDVGDPLVYVRGLTVDPNTVVSVVMPEVVFSDWRALLHNQHALYIKRLLLFEPRSSSPAFPSISRRAEARPSAHNQQGEDEGRRS